MKQEKSIPNIFLSYSWANQKFAEAIDKDFNVMGITFLRDVRDAKYRTSIKEFMQRIGKSDFVVIIISDEFLRSEYCMYEMTELLNTHEFEQRVLPLSLENARALFKPKTRTVYYDYWKEELAAAEKLLQQYLNEDYMLQKKKIETIYLHLDDFFTKITDLNVLSFDTLREDHYRPMLDILGFAEELLIGDLISINNITDAQEKEIALDDFLENHPRNEHAMFIKAVLATNAGQYKIAKALYEKIVKVNPASPTVYNNLALLYHNFLTDDESNDRFKKAKELYEQEIELNPNYDAVHYNLAVLLSTRFADYQGAKEQYLKAIEINPGYLKAHLFVAKLFFIHFEDYDAAKWHYEKCLEINPEFAPAHSNLALLLKNHFKDYKAARFHFEKAIEINPGFAVAHYQLAELFLLQLLDIEAAKKHYLKATEIDPDLKRTELENAFGITR